MKNIRLIACAGLLFGCIGSANATIIAGDVTFGAGDFFKLSPGFTDSEPDNTLGDDTFQNPNLYGFDEDQNTQIIGSDLNVDILASTGVSGSLALGTVVASHYVFFDPDGLLSQEGWVDFDSDILAIISSTENLAASDYLVNTGITYLNPSLRGLEDGDSATIDGGIGMANRLLVDWRAGTPGDYIRVLTAFSPAAEIPEPGTLALFAFGLAGLGWKRRKA